MNWERTMRELHSIRAGMRRERYREELKIPFPTDQNGAFFLL
jgi:hypothetical protein